MYIGNIVTSSNLELENFKICRKLDTVDDRLPTLIIGWDKTKELVEDRVSILHKQINPKLFWTFTTKERKSERDRAEQMKKDKKVIEKQQQNLRRQQEQDAQDKINYERLKTKFEG